MIIFLLHRLFLEKALRNVLNAGMDPPISTINSNIHILYGFRKSSAIEHYYDEPTHVRSYKKKCRTDYGTFKPRENFKKFYDRIWITVTAIH